MSTRAGIRTCSTALPLVDLYLDVRPVAQQYLETWLAPCREGDEDSMPPYLEREFRRWRRCSPASAKCSVYSNRFPPTRNASRGWRGDGRGRACGRQARPARTSASANHPRNAGKHPHGDAQPLPLPVGPPASTRDTLPQHAPRGVGLAIRGQSEGFESPAPRLRRTKPKRAKADAIPAEARRTGNTTGNRGWFSCSTDGSRRSHEQ